MNFTMISMTRLLLRPQGNTLRLALSIQYMVAQHSISVSQEQKPCCKPLLDVHEHHGARHFQQFMELPGLQGLNQIKWTVKQVNNSSLNNTFGKPFQLKLSPKMSKIIP